MSHLIIRRFALVTFSDTATINFNLSYSTDPATIKAAINAATAQSRSTYASVALNAVRTSVLGSAPYRGGNEIVFYVTNDVSQDKSAVLLMATSALKATGAYIVSIGVGDQVSKKELLQIGSIFYPVADFKTLATSWQADSLVTKICVPASLTRPSTTTTQAITSSTTKPQPNICSDSDFIFVLDDAGTLDPNTDWINAKMFATNFVNDVTAAFPSPRCVLSYHHSNSNIYFVISIQFTSLHDVTVIASCSFDFHLIDLQVCLCDVL